MLYQGVKLYEFYTFLSTEQRQTLSANQLHSLEILACTNQELDSFLTKEYLENPMLESSVNKENKLLADVESIYEKNKSYRDYYLEEDSSVEKRRSDIPAKPDLQFKIFFSISFTKMIIPTVNGPVWSI